MWCQASRYLYRNQNLAEITLKLLSCGEISLFSPLGTPIRQIQNTAQQPTTKAQKVVNVKYTSKGRRRIEIYPPPSLIPSQSVVLPVSNNYQFCFILFIFYYALIQRHYSGNFLKSLIVWLKSLMFIFSNE